MIFKLSDTMQIQLTKTLLILSTTIIPLAGICLVTKISCRNTINEIPKKLLIKIFIISLILTIFSAIYITMELNMYGNDKEGILAYIDGKEIILSSEQLEKTEEYAKNFLVLANAKSIMKALIISTLYIGALVIIFVIPINVVLENKTTTAEKNQIKIKLKEMNEVISYDTEYGHKIVEEQLGNILDDLQTNINNFPECYRIIIHYKDKENVKQQLEELEGIKSLNFGL